MENSTILSSFIPLEVWYNILKRMPTKSLSRFRCVSKTWNSLIRSPDFIADHHAAAAATATARNTHLFVQIGGYRTESLGFGKHLLIDLKPLESGLNFLQPSVSTIPYSVLILSCADGVLLGSIISGNEFRLVLCNPAINRYVVLPEPVSYPHRDQLGLGFVPSKNDIGVVKIIDNTRDVGNRRRLILPLAPIVKVCYARERVWKTIAPGVASNHLLCKLPNTNCCTNGRVHWVVQSRFENSSSVPYFSEHLLVFDFERERFETLDLPVGLLKDMRWQNSSITLQLYKQNLSVLFHGSESYSLWSLAAYPDVSSWAKMWSFDKEREVLYSFVVGCRADCKLIVSRDEEHITRVHDLDVGSSRESESYVLPLEEGMSAEYVWGFNESLFLLDEEMQSLPLTQIQATFPN